MTILLKDGRRVRANRDLGDCFRKIPKGSLGTLYDTTDRLDTANVFVIWDVGFESCSRWPKDLEEPPLKRGHFWVRRNDIEFVKEEEGGSVGKDKRVRMKNRYPANCSACGRHIPVGEVIYGKKLVKGWDMVCYDCWNDAKPSVSETTSESVIPKEIFESLKKMLDSDTEYTSEDMELAFKAALGGKDMNLERQHRGKKEREEPKEKPVNLMDALKKSAKWGC